MFDLYIMETCPYCKKVMAFLNERQIEYNKIDIADKSNEEALLKYRLKKIME